MKDYQKDFEEKVEDESYSDYRLVEIARKYIADMQKKLDILEKTVNDSLDLLKTITGDEK